VNSFERKAPIEINAKLTKRSIEDKLRIDRVVDFIEQRKFVLLRNLPENISLQQLCEELNLDFKEINTIYDNKVNDYREN